MELLDNPTTLERMLLDRAKRVRTPANGSIELLPLCNMNCDMCYVRLSRREMEAQGRLRTAEEWLEVGRQMKEAGVLFLLLTGGEPFLYPEFRKVYLGLRQMGMILTINTNGTLIDEDLAAFFGKYKPRRVNITLYGADDGAYERLCHYPGGYAKTLRGIRLLREQEVDVKVGGSLTPANQKDLDRLLDLEQELGVPVRVDTYMLPYVLQAVEQADRPEQGKEAPVQMACMAGQCSFTINWQGEMRPCVILNKPAFSVFELGFEEAWKRIVEETGKIRLNSKCSVCRARHLCRTCAASALLEAGSFEAVPEYMCRYAEESLRLLRKERERMENGRDISDR